MTDWQSWIGVLLCLSLFSALSLFAEEQPVAPYEASLEEAEKDAVKWQPESAEGYLNLHDCIELALKRNFRILEAQEQIQKQSGIELQAKAAMNPKLLAQAEYRKLDQDRLPAFDGNSFGSDENWNGDVEVEQPLFLGGGGLAERREQRYRSEAAEFALQSVVNNVLFDVHVVFYDVLLARARIAVRADAVKLLEEELQSERNRLDAGTVSQFNVLRAEVELANARTPLIQSRNDFRIALEELNQILAVQHDNPGAVVPSIQIQGALEFEEPLLDLQGALAQARQQRPEIQRLKLLIDAEEEGVKLARSDFFPELSAFAGYGGESSRFDDSLSEVDHGWEVGLRTRWKIFDGGRTIGKLREAHASKRQFEIALKQQTLNVDIDVRRSMSGLVEARELVLASKKVVEQAEESLRLARARLDAGSARQLDVLDTRVSLTEAQTNEIESLHSFNVAYAGLTRAVGKFPVEFRLSGDGDMRRNPR